MYSSTPIPELERFALGVSGPVTTGSLAYKLIRMYDDLYMPVSVYPTLAAGARVTSSTGTWTFGATSEIMPSGTVNYNFLIKGVAIETMSKDGSFELAILSGQGDVEEARVRFSCYGGFFGGLTFELPSALVPSGDRVRAKLACSVGNVSGATGTFSILYRPIIP